MNYNTTQPIETLEDRVLLAATIPHFDHVVVVMEENHSYNEIIGSSSAPYINSLANNGALFTNSFAIEHPSQPNYLDFFSGSNQGVTDDSFVSRSLAAANLGSELISAGNTFNGYSEDLPSAGSQVETSGAYAKKHNPWSDFTNVPNSSNQPFTSFPSDFTTLPTVSVVVPNLNNDMHDGSIQQGDSWLQSNLSGYATWAKTHNSLLVVTWDEDDSSQNNKIPTIFYGANVQTGKYSETINHFNVLRTLEDMYSLPAAGQSASATSITDVFQAPVVSNPPTVATPASAVVSSKTAALSVLGADDGGEANLTYTWATTGTVPAAVAFSVNGTNAAKNTTATFTKAGTYNFVVTIKDAGGLTVTSNVSAVVNQTLTAVKISPTSVSIAPAATQQFTASANDQFGNAMATQPVFTWTATGGTVTNAGLFTAGAAGSGTVTATNGTLNAVANVTITTVPQTTSVALSSLNWTTATIGWGTIHKNASVEGNPLTLHGVKYTTGIGTHAVSKISYNLNGQYQTFTSDIGVDDEVLPDSGHLIFEVWGDGVKLYGSGAMTNATATKHINISVAGVKTLQLIARNSLSGTIDYDHADWAGAMLTTGTPINNNPPTIVTPASVVVSSTTAALSVLGADDGGEASLVYTWATTGTVPAPVTFSVNGTNAAKNTVATFTKAGTYNFRVTVKDTSGQTVTSNVTAVVAQSLKTISVSPATSTVALGGTQQLTATANDQFGNALATQPAITWSLLSGTGSISSTGLYTPNAVGTATVKAANGTVSGTASITVSSITPVPPTNGLPSLTPPSVPWGGPIVITAGGVYQGNWQSLNANTPAVTIATSQPVTILNSNIESRGGLIISTVNGVNLTVKHTTGYALNPNVNGVSPGRFIDLENFANLDCENNTFVGTAGIELGFWQGGGTVKVLDNSALNIDGRLSNGNGGFQTANADLVQFVQFNHNISMPNVEIAWNQVVNQPGSSAVEDNISIFQSSGTAASPILIHDNYIQGAYPADPLSADYSGGGIMVSDGWTGSAATDTGYVNCYNNTVVSTTNYGIAIASGQHDNVYNNVVISSGQLPNGTLIPAQNVGIYVWNQGDPNFGTANVHDNQVGWQVGSSRNDYWLPNVTTSSNNTSISGTITLQYEQNEWSSWLNELLSKGIQVGV